MNEKKKKKPLLFYRLDAYIVNHYGVDAACVHGVIRNKSQTEGFVCELSEETIGNILHMSYQRVGNATDILLANGFIEPTKGKTNLKTNAYQCVLSKCDIGLSKENMITLKSNDARVTIHKENKNEYAKGLVSKAGATKHISKKVFDDMNPISKQASDDTNPIPIKNCFKELNKEIKTTSFSFYSLEEQKVKNELEVEFDYKFSKQKRWKEIFAYIIDRQKHNQSFEKLITHLITTNFKIQYMNLERLKEIYENYITVNGFQKDFCPPLWEQLGKTKEQFEEEQLRESQRICIPMPNYAKVKKIDDGAEERYQQDLIRFNKS